jgi:hypothetical protein
MSDSPRRAWLKYVNSAFRGDRRRVLVEVGRRALDVDGTGARASAADVADVLGISASYAEHVLREARKAGLLDRTERGTRWGRDGKPRASVFTLVIDGVNPLSPCSDSRVDSESQPTLARSDSRVVSESTHSGGESTHSGGESTHFLRAQNRDLGVLSAKPREQPPVEPAEAFGVGLDGDQPDPILAGGCEHSRNPLGCAPCRRDRRVRGIVNGRTRASLAPEPRP